MVNQEGHPGVGGPQDHVTHAPSLNSFITRSSQNALSALSPSSPGSTRG